MKGVSAVAGFNPKPDVSAAYGFTNVTKTLSDCLRKCKLQEQYHRQESRKDRICGKKTRSMLTKY